MVPTLGRSVALVALTAACGNPSTATAAPDASVAGSSADKLVDAGPGAASEVFDGGLQPSAADQALDAGQHTAGDAAHPGDTSASPISEGGPGDAGYAMADTGDAGDEEDAGGSAAGPVDQEQPSSGQPGQRRGGEFIALTYNVAGLPEPLSSSMPLTNSPLIGPLLNGYDLAFLQETWLTPEDNPLAPLRGYHEILVASADHPYKTQPCEQPFGADASRPTALLCDGLNIFARFELGQTTRVAWRDCVDTEADCFAFKGFSMTTAQLSPGASLHLYDLHMEAGDSSEDDEARDAGIDQLLAFIAEQSSDSALIVAGDFNLHTDREPAASQLQRLLTVGELTDACAQLDCPSPGNIDKILYRSSPQLQLDARSWTRDTTIFVTDSGEPLSDHAPVIVDFAWQQRSDP